MQEPFRHTRNTFARFFPEFLVPPWTKPSASAPFPVAPCLSPGFKSLFFVRLSRLRSPAYGAQLSCAFHQSLGHLGRCCSPGHWGEHQTLLSPSKATPSCRHWLSAPALRAAACCGVSSWFITPFSCEVFKTISFRDGAMHGSGCTIGNAGWSTRAKDDNEAEAEVKVPRAHIWVTELTQPCCVLAAGLQLLLDELSGGGKVRWWTSASSVGTEAQTNHNVSPLMNGGRTGLESCCSPDRMV